MMSQKPRAQAQCEKWNEENPEGTPVTLKRDNGVIEHTVTRSYAYVCESGYAVIFLKGIIGYYLLDRVERAPTVGTGNDNG